MRRINLRKLSPVFALSALLLIGALVALASPRGSTTPASLAVSQNQSASPSSTSTAVPVNPTATSTKAPHQAAVAPSNPTVAPTDTPTAPPAATPTDTPAPPPTPTATPAPSWHVIGSYSGSSPQTFPTFTTANPWRFDWTCTPDPTTTHSFAFSLSADGTQFAALGDQCTSQNPTSGSVGPCQPGGQSSFPCDASHTYTISSYQSGPDPMCNWTVTISEWY